MIIGIILAAGQGTRLGYNEPKQFLKVGSKRLYQYSLEAFAKSNVDQIYVVTNPEYFDLISQENSINKLAAVIKGGLTRQESVFNALSYLESKVDKSDLILIHDSARPLITPTDINRLIDDTKKYKATVACSSITDTVVESREESIANTLNRDFLKSLQTPQGFIFNEIYEAHKIANKMDLKNVSDDSQLMKLVYCEVHLTPVVGNLKITTKEDLDYFLYLIQGGNTHGK